MVMIMASNKIIILLFFFFFFITLLYSSPTKAQPTFLSHACSSNKTFTPKSSFRSHLTTLFSSLSSTQKDFFKTTVSRGDESAYGLFMCRGDITLDVCHQCVVEATKRLTSDCEFSKEAVIWYDECMLRYSNTSFFSTFDTRPRLGLLNTGNIANPGSFMRLLFTTMNKTADVAAKPALDEKKYATNEAFISGFQTLYVLAQCTPDLSPSDCRRCLSGTIGDLNWCCNGKQGGRVLYPSCNVRYELYPFYQTPA